MRVRIGDQHWTIQFSRRLKSSAGNCNYDSRTIKISPDQSEKDILETAVHELLHAALPHHREDVINLAGRDIAAALWSLGYRRQ